MKKVAHPKAQSGQHLSSREKIVHAAGDLFESVGFHGTGLTEIVRKGKAPMGSIYYHFPGGKEQIAGEAILLAGRTLAERIRATMLKRRNPAEAVRTFIERVSFSVMESGYRSGGPLAIIALETAATNKRLNQTCREAYGLIADAFKEKLCEYGFPEEEAISLSTGISAALEGGIILSRTYHSREPLRTVARLVGEMLHAADVSARHSTPSPSR